MIEEAEIIDFQSHKRTLIEFDKNVTTIVGPTDRGKSAIIRAIGWAMTNKPNGDSFIRNGCKSATVNLKVDGRTVTRTRGKDNTYSLDDDTYKAFGASIPEPIEEFLRVNSVNVQSQYDAPFWFALSPGEVSRQLNAIIDLSIIDTVMAKAASELRKRKQLTEFNTSRKEAALQDRKNLKWVVECKADLDELVSLEKSKLQAEEDMQDLVDVLYDLTAINRTKVSATEASSLGVECLKLYDEARELSMQHSSLSNILEDLEEAEAENKQPPSFEKVSVLFQQLEEARDKFEMLEHLIDNTTKALSRVKGTQASLTEAHNNYHKSIKGKLCPTCGTQM